MTLDASRPGAGKAEVAGATLDRPDPDHAIFIAAPLSPEARAAVSAMVEGIRERAPGTRPGAPTNERHVRWVRLDGLHLTLRFIGPTDPGRLDDLAAAVRRAAAAVTPFPVILSGGGGFPNPRRPRTLWIAAVDGIRELTELDATVDREVVRAGWEADQRPFVPHLTLARSDGVAGGSETLRLLVEAARVLEVTWHVDRLMLFESITGGGPARYRPLLTVPLGGAAAG